MREKLRIGDKVRVIKGKWRGETGTVIGVDIAMRGSTAFLIRYDPWGLNAHRGDPGSSYKVQCSDNSGYFKVNGSAVVRDFYEAEVVV